jgi:hypothetical protein
MASRSFLSMMRCMLLGVLLSAIGCAAHHAAPTPLLVVGVKTAHHGACPPASRRIFGARAAQLFSQPIPYLLYKCISYTEADLLQTGCGGHAFGKSIVFLTLDRTRSVRFEQYGGVFDARVRTFGEAWDDELHRATLFFAVVDFPRPPLRSGARPFVYRGPPFYGEFAIEGDPLGISGGECPTAT